MTKERENKLFPIFLKLENFRLLIVGGGKVALEKLNAVLQNSPKTQITLVAKTVIGEIEELGRRYPNLAIWRREFVTGDLNEKDLIIVAVNNTLISSGIKREAEKRKIIANVADTPGQCDFYLGSIVQKGEMKIAISTNGKSPTIAKRMRETLDENLPGEINQSLTNLSKLREYLRGDFTQKVKELNEITSTLATPAEQKKQKKLKRRRILFSVLFAVLLLITGYLFAFAYSPESLGRFFERIDISQWKFALIGLTAEVINGALGMAYGLTTTTMLLASGIAPATALIIVHILEVFTAGTAGAIHYRIGNMNKRLLKHLLIPGIAGAVAGACLLFAFRSYVYIIRPAVSVYTLLLGVAILVKAVKKSQRLRKKIKNIYPLAFIAGFLDSIGGGGWGTIISSKLIAGGRSPRHTIGSVVLSRCLVALASSVSLLFLIGFYKWSVIFWLIIGGVAGAPAGPYITRYIPVRAASWLVGITIVALSIKQIFF